MTMAQLRALSPADREELVEAYWRDQDARVRQPLRSARLWHRDDPLTSQRRATTWLGDLYTFVLGGNRSGKSEGGAQADVACALGSAHPDARQWAEANGFPLDRMPEGPGRVAVVAQDHSDSRRYVRPAVNRYLPAGSRWRNQYGNGEAEVRLPGGGCIVFLAVSEGPDAFEGDVFCRIRFDEEPNDLKVVDAAVMRLVDHRPQSHCVLTMTPLRGQTRLLDRAVGDDKLEGTEVHWLHGRDNPYLPPGELEKVLAGHGPHEREARLYGRITALEGRVYQFDRRRHVVPAHEVPASWTRYGMVDFGARNPFCYLHCALSPDDVLHILAVHYQSGWTLAKHAAVIKAMWDEHRGYPTDEEGNRIEEPEPEEGAEPEEGVERQPPHPAVIWADPAGKQERMELAALGVTTAKGRKDIRSGINAVATRLGDPDDPEAPPPGLLVHDCCVPVIREFQGYVWAERKTKGDQPDLPEKADDHAMDGIRYGCMGLGLRFGVA